MTTIEIGLTLFGVYCVGSPLFCALDGAIRYHLKPEVADD